MDWKWQGRAKKEKHLTFRAIGTMGIEEINSGRVYFL